jgi:DNA-binding response OmpR family regulator
MTNAPLFLTLVVERNASFGLFLQEFFAAEGNVILLAHSDEEALNKTRQFHPQLILLDAGLDGVAGLPLLPELLLECATAAVVLLAAFPNVDGAVDAMKLGAADYLPWPLSPGRLRRAIESQKALAAGMA